MMFAGAILALMGVVSIVFAMRERGIRGQLATQGLQAPATVTNIQRHVTRTSKSRDVDWIVSFNFTTMDGQNITGSKVYETRHNLPEVGEVLEVTYLLDNPKRHRLSKDVNSQASIIIGLVVGFGMSAVGAVVFFVGLAQML